MSYESALEDIHTEVIELGAKLIVRNSKHSDPRLIYSPEVTYTMLLLEIVQALKRIELAMPEV